MAAWLSWLDRRGNNRKFAGSMPVLDINTNFLTYTLCGVED